MKSTIKAFLLLIVALSMSCNSDDDSSDPSIIGTFVSISGVEEEFINGVSQGSENIIIDENNFTRVTFNADNTFSSFFSESFESNGEEQIFTGTLTGTYSIEGNVLTIFEVDDSEVQEASFTLVGDILTVITEDEDTFDSETTLFVITTVFERE